MLDTILIFLNLLRFDLWPKMWSILENVPCALKKKVYSAFGMSWRYQWDPSHLMYHLRCVSLLTFCFDDLSISVRRRKWQPTPVFLPRESCGQRSLVGYSPRGCRVGHNWATSLTDSLTPMDRSSKQKINKETQVLNDTLDEMDLIDIFRAFHPNAEEYTFFSSAHGTFSWIDHILGHKSNLSKFKKTEIISSNFS